MNDDGRRGAPSPAWLRRWAAKLLAEPSKLDEMRRRWEKTSRSAHKNHPGM